MIKDEELLATVRRHERDRVLKIVRDVLGEEMTRVRRLKSEWVTMGLPVTPGELARYDASIRGIEGFINKIERTAGDK